MQLPMIDNEEEGKTLPVEMHFRLISLLIIRAIGKLCGDLVKTAWPRLVTKSAAQLELSCTLAANPPTLQGGE